MLRACPHATRIMHENTLSSILAAAHADMRIVRDPRLRFQAKSLLIRVTAVNDEIPYCGLSRVTPGNHAPRGHGLAGFFQQHLATRPCSSAGRPDERIA
jgi:hypothetical protein